MFLHRKIETNLKDWMDREDRHPLLVRGVRRCGKTTTIESVGRERFGAGFVKLDFQTNIAAVSALFNGPTDDVDRIVSNIAESLHVKLDPSSTLIFFDEVQLCERALNSLRFFSGSPWRVIASGSLLGVSAGERKLPFPSGVRQIKMHPMDFEEFLWAVGSAEMASAIRSHFESLEPYAAHEEALRLYHRFLVVGGMPRVVASYLEMGIDEVRIEQSEIDATYTADMTNPALHLSGISAKRIWDSLPKQLLRSTTKKFKYADVVRGGRRQRLMEPLEWLDGAGVLTICEMTKGTSSPLMPYDEEDGSFFKVYVADTGIMFHKFGIDPTAFLRAVDSGEAFASSDFRGALAENAVAQALSANDLLAYYWTPPTSWGARGELDFLLQTTHAELIPIEVKSGRNVGAKTLASFMRKAGAPAWYRLSERQFGKTVVDDGTERRVIPLYSAYCLGDGCIKRPL